MNRDYLETVRLMLRVMPLVFSTGVFAMKGGTAINLFLTDTPRLSVLEAFPVYLAGHNRPPHEILNGKNKNIGQLYESALMGMTRDEAPTGETLTKIRSRLRAEITSGLSPTSREFLRGFFELEPDWSLLPYKNAQDLPALRWKLINLHTFKKNQPEKFKSQNTELARLLDLDPQRNSNLYQWFDRL